MQICFFSLFKEISWKTLGTCIAITDNCWQMTWNSGSQQANIVSLSLSVSLSLYFSFTVFFPQLWFVPFFDMQFYDSQFPDACCSYETPSFHFSSFEAYLREKARGMLSMCIYVNERICVWLWLQQLCMPALRLAINHH